MRSRVAAEALDRLAEEMVAYSQGREPFNPAYMPSAGMSVMKWWLSLGQAGIIVTLAVILYGIVPHAASTERDFSIMKWLNAPRRSSQSVATLKRLVRLRTTLTSLCQPPRCVARRPSTYS